MGREAGVEDWHDLPRLRRVLRERFAPEWEFLRRMPTVLETPRHVFVHGGVPSLTGMEQLSRWACMKNDNFLGQGRSFPKWVVVGHWPVTLYHPCIPSAAPLFSPSRHIISIDGGCVLKADGQLNALVIPGAQSEDFSVISYDGLPTVLALDPQEENIGSVNIRWGRSALTVLRPGEELSLCRHLETGRVLWVLTRYLRRQGDRVWCEDSTDYRLSVSPGDRLHLVQATSRGFLCKKEGVSGWYFGRVSDII